MHVQIDNREWLISYLKYCKKIGRYHSWTYYNTLTQKLNWVWTDYPFWIQLWNMYWMTKYLPSWIILNRKEWSFYLKSVPNNEDF